MTGTLNREPSAGGPAGEAAAFRQVRAWFLLVAALAVHVADEALTGFLDFYNPLVLSIRSQIAWFPMPTFMFGTWLAGLAAVVVGLALLGPVVRRGSVFVSVAAWVFAIIMLLNGIGHLAGSMYFQKWLPGATSAPLLIAASALLMHATWQRHARQLHSGVD
jgi:hypothetical protein